MTNSQYRSYLIRIRRRQAPEERGDARGPAEASISPGVIRADVEDLLGGARGRIDGETARLLAAGLEALVRPPDPNQSATPVADSAPETDGPPGRAVA